MGPEHGLCSTETTRLSDPQTETRRYFFCDKPPGGASAKGRQPSGTITVNTTGDDDFVGFVLGYQAHEINSMAADFWLIDWKQGDQSPANDGLALRHVFGDLTTTIGGSFGGGWNHASPINEVARGTTLGSTGWNDVQIYTLDPPSPTA